MVSASLYVQGDQVRADTLWGMLRKQMCCYLLCNKSVICLNALAAQPPRESIHATVVWVVKLFGTEKHLTLGKKSENNVSNAAFTIHQACK